MSDHRLGIVMAVDHFPPEPVYGYDRWAESVAMEFAARGHRVTVIAPRWSTALPEEQQRDDGVVVQRFTPRRLPGFLWMFRRRVGYLGAKSRIADCNESHDVIIGLPQYIHAARRWAPRLKRVYRGGGTLLGAKQFETFLWPPNASLRTKIGSYIGWHNLLHHEKAALRSANAIVVPSDNIKQQLIYYYKTPADRVRVIHHGANLRRFAPHDRPWDGVLRVVSVGRLHSIKNHALLVDAAARMERPDQLRIRIVGEGSLRRDLETQIARLGLEKTVSLTGYCADIEQHYRWADVFVLPSVHEPFGIVVVEAMSSGLPCVGLKTDPPEVWTANDELIDDGKTGLLVAKNDPKLLANALTRFVNQPELIETMGRKSRERAETYFTWTQAVERYERFLGELAGID